MIKLTKKQVDERFDTLPENLRDAILSPENSDMVWRIGEENHLDEQKISAISSIAGRVILGFIHYDDFIKEVGKTININPELTASITREIDKKIFAPIRADLEKVYMPPAVGRPEPEIAESKAEEVVVKEIEFKPEKIEIKEEKTTEVPPKTIETKPEIPKEGMPKIISEAGPAIIQKEFELRPKITTEPAKKSFGGLLSFLIPKKKDAGVRPITAEIKMDEEILKEIPKPQMAKTEQEKPRIVSYTEPKAGPFPFPEPSRQAGSYGANEEVKKETDNRLQTTNDSHDEETPKIIKEIKETPETKKLEIEKLETPIPPAPISPITPPLPPAPQTPPQTEKPRMVNYSEPQKDIRNEKLEIRDEKLDIKEKKTEIPKEQAQDSKKGIFSRLFGK